jgi:hypothetical protein
MISVVVEFNELVPRNMLFPQKTKQKMPLYFAIVVGVAWAGHFTLGR